MPSKRFVLGMLLLMTIFVLINIVFNRNVYSARSSVKLLFRCADIIMLGVGFIAIKKEIAASLFRTFLQICCFVLLLFVLLKATSSICFMLGLQQAGIKLIVYIDRLLGITYIFTPVPFVIIWLIDKVFYKNNWVKEVDDFSNK